MKQGSWFAYAGGWIELKNVIVTVDDNAPIGLVEHLIAQVFGLGNPP